MNCWSEGCQTKQAITIIVVCPPELGDKIVLLKMLPAWLTRHSHQAGSELGASSLLARPQSTGRCYADCGGIDIGRLAQLWTLHSKILTRQTRLAH